MLRRAGASIFLKQIDAIAFVGPETPPAENYWSLVVISPQNRPIQMRSCEKTHFHLLSHDISFFNVFLKQKQKQKENWGKKKVAFGLTCCIETVTMVLRRRRRRPDRHSAVLALGQRDMSQLRLICCHILGPFALIPERLSHVGNNPTKG